MNIFLSLGHFFRDSLYMYVMLWADIITSSYRYLVQGQISRIFIYKNERQPTWRRLQFESSAADIGG